LKGGVLVELSINSFLNSVLKRNKNFQM
jgi:hypothetical protein